MWHLTFVLFYYFSVATEALRILLARAQLDEVLTRLDEDNAWDKIKEENTHVTGVTLLARYTQTHNLQYMHKNTPLDKSYHLCS